MADTRTKLLRQQLAVEITRALHEQAIFISQRFIETALPEDLSLRITLRGKKTNHLLDVYNALGLEWGDDPFVHIDALLRTSDSASLRAVINERYQQRLRFNADADAVHTDSELATLAIAYIRAGLAHDPATIDVPDGFEVNATRSSDDDLVAAAALLLAELDRREHARAPFKSRD